MSSILGVANQRKHAYAPTLPKASNEKGTQTLEEGMGALTLEGTVPEKTQQPKEAATEAITLEGTANAIIPFIPEEATPLPEEESGSRSKMHKPEPSEEPVIPTMPLMRTTPPISIPLIPGDPLEDERAYYHNFVHNITIYPQITHHIANSFSMLKAEKVLLLGGGLNTGATTINMLLKDKGQNLMEVEDSQIEHAAASDIQNFLIKYQLPHEELAIRLPANSDHSFLSNELKNIFKTSGGPLVIEIPYHHRSRWIILDAFVETTNPIAPKFMVRDSLYEVGYICPIEALFPKLKTDLPLHVFRIM